MGVGGYLILGPFLRDYGMCVCACVCVCMRYRSGMFKGGTRLVMHNFHTCTLYCVCVIRSRHNRGAAGEQQLKRAKLLVEIVSISLCTS